MEERKVTLVMSIELYESVVRIGKEENRTVSAMIRNALEQYIASYYLQKNLRNGELQKVLAEIKEVVEKSKLNDIIK